MKSSLQKLYSVQNIIYLIILVLFVFSCFFYYYGYFKYQYALPTGDDPVRHITNTIELSESGFLEIEEGTLDPPFINILFVTLSEISGFEIYKVYTYGIPFLTIVFTFSIYLVAKRFLDNQKAALVSLLLLILISPQPTRIFEDGTFMNLFGAFFFLPLYMVFCFLYLKEKGKPVLNGHFIAAVLFGTAVLSYQSLAGVYLALIFILLFIFILFFQRKKNTFIRYFFLAGTILVLGLPVAYETYIKRTVLFVFEKVGIIGAKSTDLVLGGIGKDPASAVVNFGTFEWFFSYLGLLFGVMGIVLYFFSKKKGLYEKLLLLAWPIALFIGSQIEAMPLSQRFGRDLAYPLMIFGGLFVVWVFTLQKKRFSRQIVFFLLMVGIIFSSLFFVINKVDYNPLQRVQEVDLMAYNWILENTRQDDVILLSPGIGSGDWGNYPSIITNRVFIDGAYCEGEHSIGDTKCDFIYETEKELVKNFYLENDIAYVYSGKRILGSHHAKERIDWSYPQIFEKTSYLKKETSFLDEKLGPVEIYKVNKEKLRFED